MLYGEIERMWDGQMPQGNWMEGLMPDPRDGKCGKMSHYCSGGGGGGLGGWALLELIDALPRVRPWSYYMHYFHHRQQVSVSPLRLAETLRICFFVRALTILY